MERTNDAHLPASPLLNCTRTAPKTLHLSVVILRACHRRHSLFGGYVSCSTICPVFGDPLFRPRTTTASHDRSRRRRLPVSRQAYLSSRARTQRRPIHSPHETAIACPHNAPDASAPAAHPLALADALSALLFQRFDVYSRASRETLRPRALGSVSFVGRQTSSVP